MSHLAPEGRKAIVEKALNRKDKSLSEIAKAHNVGLSTLQRWIRRYKDGKPNILTGSHSSNKPLTRAEQLDHLLATSRLDDVEVGAYCREHGLYSFQIQQWKNEFMTNNDSQKKRETQAELKALRVENKLLKKDLLRKDRALAETTALLVLKKKRPCSLGKERTFGRSRSTSANY